jgi:hypothetical protein
MRPILMKPPRRIISLGKTGQAATLKETFLSYESNDFGWSRRGASPRERLFKSESVSPARGCTCEGSQNEAAPSGRTSLR